MADDPNVRSGPAAAALRGRRRKVAVRAIIRPPKKSGGRVSGPAPFTGTMPDARPMGRGGIARRINPPRGSQSQVDQYGLPFFFPPSGTNPSLGGRGKPVVRPPTPRPAGGGRPNPFGRVPPGAKKVPPQQSDVFSKLQGNDAGPPTRRKPAGGGRRYLGGR